MSANVSTVSLERSSTYAVRRQSSPDVRQIYAVQHAIAGMGSDLRPKLGCSRTLRLPLFFGLSRSRTFSL